VTPVSSGLSLFFDQGDRLLALRIAADVLRSQQPCHCARCYIFADGQRCLATAEWRWPGVVIVSIRETGEFIAQSLPGRPYELSARKPGFPGNPS
jgi:hypothetical protein